MTHHTYRAVEAPEGNWAAGVGQEYGVYMQRFHLPPHSWHFPAVERVGGVLTRLY
jgi:hypothetical protein